VDSVSPHPNVVKRGIYRAPLRYKKHIRHKILFQPDKTLLIGHSIERYDLINFKNEICEYLLKDSISILIHTNNFNRDKVDSGTQLLASFNSGSKSK
jgi:16S rRNA G1207 methylase RsmC